MGAKTGYFLSIRTKIVILLLAAITIPFIISGILTYVKYTQDSEKSTAKFAGQIVSQISMNLDRYIKEMERVTLAPLYDAAVMEILDKHSDPERRVDYLHMDEKLKMIYFTSSMEFDRAEIRGIVFFANDGAVFSDSEVTTKMTWSSEENDWMAAVDAENGGLAILPPHEVSYYNSGRVTVVSLARQIREPYTYRKLGIVKVDLNAAGMKRILSEFNLGIVDSKLFVIDKFGQQLYPFSQEENLVSADDELITASVHSDYTGLVVTGQVPKTELRHNALELTRFTVIISIASLLAAFVIAIIASNRLIRPLLHLRRKMSLVQTGSFSVRADMMTNDEIGDVTRSFNNMVSEIQRLVKEVYEVKLREKESELFALQSQMNPHFLNNTLESISMLAIQQNQLSLSSHVTSLGRMLRYTMDNRQPKVVLLDEIKFAQAYFQIQMMRLGDMLISEIDVPPELEHALVPKLLIQPLIENAIEHGMDDEPLTIRVSAELEEERLKLVVEDDGRGMEEKAIRELTERISREEPEVYLTDLFESRRKGYALRNAHQRIRLLYGDDYGIDIRNRPGKGIRFMITLPLEWRTEA